MNDLVRHRGPDDEGYYFGPGFAFGHRRLSILDLSDAGKQPMMYMGRYVIVYNGEVYNYIEIRKELEKSGYEFRSNSDTEVILASYDLWGEKCVHQFNGMWAFAIFDKQTKKIFCSRDRFGIKPFYYAEANGKFIFGSEIKQLLIHLSNLTANERILTCFLVTRFQEYDDETFFSGIRKLLGGHNLVYDILTHQYRIYRYYDIHFDPMLLELSESEAIELYKEKFERAVTIRMRSDVKVGTCLSGGMDSSSVATVASSIYRKQANGRFNAITAKSIDSRFDESMYAHMVAKHANLDWNVVTPTYDDFLKAVDTVVHLQEEPFNGPSIIMQYFVFQKAKELGCTVMLDGQGGDETLLGYEKYLPAVYIDYWRNTTIRRTLHEIYLSICNNQNMPFGAILFYSVGSLFPLLRKKEHVRRCSFLNSHKNGIFGVIDDLSKSYFDVQQLQQIEIQRTNLTTLLKYEDKNSMWHSVESRLPFLDFQALETALGISTAHKVKGGWTKYLLRKMMTCELPPEIVWRKNKLGFNAPEALWINQYHRQMIDTISKSLILDRLTDKTKLLEKYPRLDAKLKWRLFNIARWESLYEVTLQ